MTRIEDSSAESEEYDLKTLPSGLAYAWEYEQTEESWIATFLA